MIDFELEINFEYEYFLKKLFLGSFLKNEKNT